MTGKFVVIFTLVAALIVGGAIYYLQVYAYYRELAYHPGDVTLVLRATGQPEEISVADYRAIDADSSPLRYRACFTVTATPDAIDRTYEPYGGPEPLTGPGWFDCYDAGRITEALETGEARAFLARKNIEYGVCLLYTSPSPRDRQKSRMPSSA